jgi:hypothetical protein
MTTVKEYLDVARKQIGNRESPPGSEHTKYSEFYGVDDFWCAMFQWWVAAHAGDKNPMWTKTAYTPTLQNYFVDEKRHGHKPRKGALVFFNFPDSLERTQHVEVVESFTDDQIVTVGGNTAPDQGGPSDGVYRRHRPQNSWITGYAYPPYSDSEALPKFDFPKAKTWFGLRDSGGDVRMWQRDLNRWMAWLRQDKKPDFDWGKIGVDGDFGQETLKATKTFQNFYQLDSDGRVGKHTIAKMEGVLKRRE